MCSSVINKAYTSGIGSFSKVGGGRLFKLSGHICMEKITFLWSDSKNWGAELPKPPLFQMYTILTIATYSCSVV